MPAMDRAASASSGHRRGRRGTGGRGRVRAVCGGGVVTLVALLGGCRAAGPEAAAPPTSTRSNLPASPGGSPGLINVASPTSTTSTTVARARRKRSATTTTTTEATAPPLRRRGLQTPQAASKNLWDAWRDDDRPRALLYASTRSVNALFATPWDATVRDLGCEAGEDPPVCTYLIGRAAAVVEISGNQDSGFRVQRVDILEAAAVRATTRQPGATPVGASGAPGSTETTARAVGTGGEATTAPPRTRKTARAKKRTTTPVADAPGDVTEVTTATPPAPEPAPPPPEAAPPATAAPAPGERVPARVPVARSVESGSSETGS